MGQIGAVLITLVLAAFGGRSPGQEQTNTITSIQEVFQSSNPAALGGRRAEWSNVQIQRVLNAEVLLVGTKDHQVLVRRQTTNPQVRPGQMVDLTGIINQMPATTQGWDTPGTDLKLLKNQSIFLNALSLRLHTDKPGKPHTTRARDFVALIGLSRL